MQTEFEIVIADTTCFIVLENIGKLNLLKDLFGHVLTTKVIAAEFGSTLPSYVQVKDVNRLDIQSH